MTLQLTEEQRRAVAEAEEPVRVMDPQTHATYVLLPEDVYDRVRALVDLEDLSPEEKLRLLAESGRRAGWDDPAMDDYDNYDEVWKTQCR
jgi:hypothetical protein